MIFFLTGDPKFWQNEDDDNLIMCLSGDVGQGKTSILATFVERAKKVRALQTVYYTVKTVCKGDNYTPRNELRRV